MHILRRNTNTDAYAVYLGMAAASSFFFALITIVNLIYQVTTVGLNPLQLVLVGTTLEVTVFICQVPTGVIADLYSRRLSIILGTLLIGSGFFLEGAIPRFETVLVGQILWGIGITFVSGAEEAWISDELGIDKAPNAFVRGGQIGSFSGLIGIAISVLLGSIVINLPILVGGALFILMGVVLIFVMPERGFVPTPKEDRSTWQQMRHMLRGGIRLVRASPTLLTIALIGLFYGLYSEGYDRLWTDHVLTNFTLPMMGHLAPVTWFGLMRAGATLVSIVGSEGVRRRMTNNLTLTNGNPHSMTRILLAISVCQVLSLIAFGLAGNFGAAVLTFILFSAMRSMGGPLYTAWINQHMESSMRATMHSMSGQVDAFGQIVGGPLVGGFATTLGGVIGLGAALRATMVLTGMILSPVIALYMRDLRHELPEASDTISVVPVTLV